MPKSPPEKKKTLKEAGVSVDDPVFDKTAQIIDEVLQRNQKLAPYIGDTLKSGFKVAEKGKFVQELSDGNFEDSYKKDSGTGIIEIGNKLGLSKKQYADLRGEASKEVFKRMNGLL